MKTFYRFAFIGAFGLFCLSPLAAMADGVVKVPPGNRYEEQPQVPGASTRRTKGARTTFDAKYEKVRDLLATDKKLVGKIKAAARAYGIDPLHIVGAIVGEHTYNVDAYDRLQSYYIKAASYAGNTFRFGYKDESIKQFLERPQFDECNTKTGSYASWSCVERIWDEQFRGQTVDGVSFPNNRFSAVFFQPFYAGQTFGLGQINPLTAFMLTDKVSRVSGYPKLDVNDAASVYQAIMDPDISLAYMAAILRNSIDVYRSVAGMDISDNPGLTATLYNVGNPEVRAVALAARNRGSKAELPEENYYGWLVNDKLSELRPLLR